MIDETTRQKIEAYRNDIKLVAAGYGIDPDRVHISDEAAIARIVDIEDMHRAQRVIIDAAHAAFTASSTRQAPPDAPASGPPLA
jgi:hypothetical protein